MVVSISKSSPSHWEDPESTHEGEGAGQGKGPFLTKTRFNQRHRFTCRGKKGAPNAVRDNGQASDQNDEVLIVFGIVGESQEEVPLSFGLISSGQQNFSFVGRESIVTGNSRLRDPHGGIRQRSSGCAIHRTDSSTYCREYACGALGNRCGRRAFSGRPFRRFVTRRCEKCGLVFSISCYHVSARKSTKKRGIQNPGNREIVPCSAVFPDL